MPEEHGAHHRLSKDSPPPSTQSQAAPSFPSTMVGSVIYEVPPIRQQQTWASSSRHRDSDPIAYSPVDSQHSPFDIPPNVPAFHMGYHPAALSPTHHLGQLPLQPGRYHMPGYYYGERDAAQGSSRGKTLASSLHSSLNPATSSQAPLLSSSSLRTYDSTIPQYYQVTSEPRWTDRSEAGQKRKRLMNTSPTPESSLQTPKRAMSHDEMATRANKRQRQEAQQAYGHQTQLPTPLSTGREPSIASDRRMSLPDASIPLRQSNVVITRTEEEGRKLGIFGRANGSIEQSEEKSPKAPRVKPVLSLVTDDSGMAVVRNRDVLESEIAWLENGGRTHSPPSSVDNTLLKTPPSTVAVLEETETPNTRQDKMTKRLGLFTGASPKLDEPMVSTRISLFGRVAVGKSFASKFLGLQPGTPLVEETRLEDNEEWSQLPVPSSGSSSSRTSVRPEWPDREAPWALAGGARKDRRLREQREKTASLRRYLESPSDESSDEGEEIQIFSGRGRGKSIRGLFHSPRAQARAKAIESTACDAKAALISSLRNRMPPSIPLGRVACACGSTSAIGSLPSIQCTGCRTWHHLQCNGIDDDAELGVQWWCAGCQAQAIALSTPARSNSGAYSQSDERSSAFKGDITNIALAPSPVMFAGGSFAAAAAAARTPLNRVMASPSSRQHRSRVLSYGTDMWAYTEDGAPSSVAPSTPGPSRPDRFSTPRIDDAPFDVTSTPSRHLDLGFGQPSLFSLTPLAGRGRVTSGAYLDATPFGARGRNISNGPPMTDMIPSRHDFFRELNKGSQSELPASPSTRWSHGLLGAHNVSPSPFGHRRNLSGNKLSSMRSSSKGGFLGVPEDREV